MAGEAEEIRKAILSLFKNKVPTVAAWYKCTAVDGKTCTILVDDDANLKVDGILLGFDKNGCVEIPKINKDVLVVFAEGSNNQGLVVLCEETEDMELMGTKYKGIPIVEKVDDNLKALKNRMDDLESAVANGLNAVGVGTSASGAAGMAAFQLEMATSQPVQLKDMEGKVKHGNGQ